MTDIEQQERRFEDWDELLAAPEPLWKAYNPDQPREPAGTPVGGQFASLIRGSAFLATKVAGPGGSNPGGVYRGTDGVERYVKFYRDPSQAYGEHLANQLYKEVGLTAPDSEVFMSAGGIAYASTMMKGARTLGSVGMTGEQADRILDGFAADVVTANWDVIGMGEDNVLVTPEGDLVRVDNGGTFLMRAQAGRKPESALLSISEYERFDTDNRSYQRVFRAAGTSPDLMRDRVAQQMQRIREVRDAAGGWDKWVAKRAAGMDEADRRKVVEMLDFRTDAMSELVGIQKAYNPDQPREPAGTPVGGRWASAGGTAEPVEWKEGWDFQRVLDVTAIETAEALRASGVMDRARDALESYITNNYDDINAAARGDVKDNYGNEIAAEDIQDARYLYWAIDALPPVPADGVVWRGQKSAYKSVRPGSQNKYLSAEQIEEIWKSRVGTEFQENGFTSTSTDRRFAASWARRSDKPRVLYKIRVPKGSKAAWVPGLTNTGFSQEEQELLIQAGATFKVMKVKRSGVVIKVGLELTGHRKSDELPFLHGPISEEDDL